MTSSGLAKTNRRGQMHHHAFDPGVEPPLSIDGQPVEWIDRRPVSVQWLTGVILTAFSGTALMVAAVFASLNGSANIAVHPEKAVLRGILGLGASQRSNRLPLPIVASFHRQVIRISTVNRVDNREVVRAQPFVCLAGALPLIGSALVDRIPPFNAQRLLAESAPGGDAPPQAAPNADVSFIMRNLATLLPKLKIKLMTPLDEVTVRVRAAATWSAKRTGHPARTAGITGIKLAYAPAAESLDIGLHIVPENVTRLAKTTDKTTGGVPFKQQTIPARKGGSIAGILHRLDATAGEITAIDDLLGGYGGKDGLRTGDRVRVLFWPIGPGKQVEPLRVIVFNRSRPEAVVALSNSGHYVLVDPSRIDSAVAERRGDDADQRQPAGGVTLYQSFYETALRHHVPRAVIDDFLRIYAFDVDFYRRVRPGDSFSLLYADNKQDAPAHARNVILFASLRLDGRRKVLYRFRSPRTGHLDYYNRHGETVRTFLLRKPVPIGRLTSGFGWRKHPILHVELMHTGVDWAAPLGTPVYAAGNGVIEYEGWESGYGKFMLLRHAYGYETAYAHLDGYARGTHVGEHVRQGQVIAFVGSTGLSTGPHLNFEFRINGHFVDPLRVKLPHSHVLHGPVLARFQQERRRIDMIMAPTTLQLAARG